ncbi:NAD-dependent epimerase/dehydratase family protein [Kitasatospora brasiliensis]|uniref:NAD-dependent epimerase/dehydratase family protein n=1 Tax=Kitasatospora brasiliensis TaxID=3058040 RepID=UPI0029307DD8|nr:NAD(P)-dependent oxidoreductase [Kitasatospora sp. K002]
MTHPKRVEAATLIARADTAGRVRVVTDPEPEGPPTALRSAALAWDAVAPDATHHLVLQDDVVLAEGFFAYAEQVAAAVPHEAVAFYAGWEGRTGAAVRLAALAGEQWTYAIEEHTPCLALMLPARAAHGYTAFAAEHGVGWPYDVVMQRYLNALEVPIRVAVPCTVDHSEVPSIAGNSTHGWREAALFTSPAVVPPTFDCAQFAVVPFYQYGDARTAVRHGKDAEWEYLETERYLRRLGLAEQCRTAFEAAPASTLSERIARPVWETAFAMGTVVAAVTAEPPAAELIRAVMDTLGPGGLCEDYTAEELGELIAPVRELALIAFAEGRAAKLGGSAGSAGPSGSAGAAPEGRARVTVTGGDGGFGHQLAGLLGDLGHRAVHLSDAPDAGQPNDGQADDGQPDDGQPDGARHLVHLGSPDDAPDALSRVLAAAARARVGRLVYVGSSAVYRGTAEQSVTEDSVTEAPGDPTAAAWWHQEEQCRRWGAEHGVEVQVLRSAEPVGPGVLIEGAAANWMHRAWTRRSLLLDRGRHHQIVDYRDLASAIDAVLSAPATRPVFNLASETYTEEELAELVALIARRTLWEDLPQPAVRQGVMATDLIETELRWRASAPSHEGLRALAQWLACDTHDAITGLPQLGSNV